PQVTKAEGIKASTGTARAGTVKGRVTKAIVGRALLRVREDLVRLGGLLELFGGLRILFVHVGVVPARQPAVGLLDLFGPRRPVDPEYLVVVPLTGHAAQAPFSLASGSFLT